MRDILRDTQQDRGTEGSWRKTLARLRNNLSACHTLDQGLDSLVVRMVLVHIGSGHREVGHSVAERMVEVGRLVDCMAVEDSRTGGSSPFQQQCLTTG